MGKIGRYQLRGEIGRGGMATVYRAVDPNSNREVAIKLLPRELMHNVEFRRRFRRELKTISSLEHAAIVPIYDSGEEHGQPYFVMRYMIGGSLAERLKLGRLSLQDTAVIIEKLALGLAYAHKQRIIHRDIKPGNILFDANDEPYLSDFGVAKLAESTNSSSGSGIVGTPAYVSPEQARGENNKIDHRSDIYGLGVLTYQMLTGQQPFKADTPMGVLVKHINEPVPNILDVNPNLTPALDTIIKTAMAKNKEDRYSSVLEFARALAVAAFGEERTEPVALVLERKQAEISARRRIGWVIACIVLLVVFAGGFISLPFIIPSPTPRPTTTASALPSVTPSHTISPSSTPSPTLTPAPEITVLPPTPSGGAEKVALLSGNQIVQTNLDGSDPESLDIQNFQKTNLQWITGGEFAGQLIYISPVSARNCAYMVDPISKQPQKLICFNRDEALDGFRVSPDGTHVAISVDKTLYIVPFQAESWKGNTILKDTLRKMENACSYFLPIKDVRWSQDGRHIAALIVDSQQAGSEQIHLFDVALSNCNLGILIPTDRFPANHFDFDPLNIQTIPSYDWDGDHLFLLNDSIRNNGFGNLYLYDSNEQQGEIVNPIQGLCCYRDARWSPDGKYVFFLYQNKSGGEIQLYYLPVSSLTTKVDGDWSPIKIPAGIFNVRENAFPALEPAQ